MMNDKQLTDHYMNVCVYSLTKCNFCKASVKRTDQIIHHCYDVYKQQAIQSEAVNQALFKFILE